MALTSNNFEEAYSILNREQKKAVDTIEGPVMVVAGPGTGKTQILTLRIANILKETQANPEDILALTFTNSGVRAMRDRLRRYIGDDAYRVGIFTFHSFAEYVLQEYRSYFPAFEFRSVISDLEKAQIIEEILESHDFTKIVSAYDRFSSLRQVMDAIDNLKQEGLSPAAFKAAIPTWEQEQLTSDDMFYKVSRGSYKAGDIKPAEQKKVQNRIDRAYEVATVFHAYQRALEKQNRYDFSDMILTVLDGLRDNEALKTDLQERYQYVLVDEHQDTNDGQNAIIEYLTDAEHLNGRPNLFTVGDEKQSIYRFQGASDKAFKHFKEHYNDVTVIELTDNYRSSEQILDSAHAVITHSLPVAQSLTSNIDETAPVEVREFSDYKFELLYVVEDIKAKITAGIDPSEIAVIYRANKHLEDIKGLFQQAGIPFHVRSRDTLLDDPSITLFIELIRVVSNPHDDHGLGELLYAEWLGISALQVTETLREYRSAVRSGNTRSLIEFLATNDSYNQIVTLINDLHGYAKNHQFVETFKEALQRSGYLTAMLQKPDSRNRLRKIEVLYNELRQQVERNSDYKASDFIAFIDATRAYNLSIDVVATQVGSGVQCMTAHGSKGLEFEQVYLINTASSNWEKRRSFPQIALPIQRYAGDVDDERRLFYVALTRAKSRLHISSSKQDWSGKALEPSRFIAELGSESVVYKGTDQFETENESRLGEFMQLKERAESVFDPTYLAEKFTAENISVTALNNFIECPLLYLFRNLIQLPDVYTPALRYGDAVHRALETFFMASVEARTLASKEILLQAYEDAVATAGFSAKDQETFRLKGRQALGAYYDYYHQDWTIQVSLEEYIRRTITIGGIELTLSGKIDKIEYVKEQGSGPVRVVDYKTGKVFSQKSTKAQKQALERQIQFYHLLLEDYKHGTVSISEAVLDFIEPTEDNEFEQKKLSVSERDLETLREQIADMVESVMSGRFLKQGCQKKECDACQLWSVIHNQ